MNAENTKKLYTDFPEFFKHRDDLQSSLMVFGFEYSDGWFDLTYKLCKDIKNYFLTKYDGVGFNDEKYHHEIPKHFYVVQCKEKFGGLRFYITCAPKEICDMIHVAESESYNICEECGKPGKLRDDLGWWLTLCDKHYKEKKDGKI